MFKDDNMEQCYVENACHYDTGLMRIGCTEKQAKEYAKYFRGVIREYYYKRVELAVNQVRDDSGKKIRILDIGCGLGDDMDLLGQRISNIEFVGIELSEAAIEICKKKQLPNVSLFVGTLDNIVFDEESFDIIINFCVLEHVESPSHIFAQCNKILKNDGIMVVAVPNHHYWLSWTWPIYLMRYMFFMDNETHSVRRDIMNDSIKNNGLKIISFDTQGYRPPQGYFRYIPEIYIKQLINMFSSVNELMRYIGLKKYLYLDIYSIIKNNNVVKELDLSNSYLKINIGKSFCIMVFNYFFWWPYDFISTSIRFIYNKIYIGQK